MIYEDTDQVTFAIEALTDSGGWQRMLPAETCRLDENETYEAFARDVRWHQNLTVGGEGTCRVIVWAGPETTEDQAVAIEEWIEEP